METVRLAFGGRGAGEQNNVGLAAGDGEQKRGAQGAEGLRELRLGVGEEAEVAHGHAELALVGGLARVRGMRASDGRPETASISATLRRPVSRLSSTKARMSPTRSITVPSTISMLERECREGPMAGNGGVNDVDLGGFEASLDAGGAQALQQVLIEGAVGFVLALAEGVLDQGIAQLEVVGGLGGEHGASLVFVGLGGDVSLAGLGEDAVLRLMESRG